MPCNPYDITHGLDSLPFLNISSTIEQLDLRGLADPEPTAFQGIPNTFPNRKVLKIQQRTIWCEFCSMCRVVRLNDPGPTKVVYEGGLGLPTHYARILEDEFQENQVEWTRSLTSGDDGNRPPKLRRVEWHFYEADDNERATRLAIFTDFEATDSEVDHERGV